MTDPSVNMFQYMGAEPAVPLWVKNTEEPRKHAESILRKYGVFESMLPSKAPGIRMCDLFRGCMLMVKPEMMSALDGPLLTDDESALKQQRTRPSPRRIGAAPYPKRRFKDPPSGRAIGCNRGPRGFQTPSHLPGAAASTRVSPNASPQSSPRIMGLAPSHKLPQIESPRLSPRAAQLSPYTSMQAKSEASLSPQSVMLLSPDLRRRIGL